MGFFKISPPWDSNEGYISECVIGRRLFNWATGSLGDRIVILLTIEMVATQIVTYSDSQTLKIAGRIV